MPQYMTHHKNRILHIDADSFFASCERAVQPAYADKPVCVVAGDHGIIIAATPDAKALGIYTAMPRWEAERILPPGKAYYVTSRFEIYARFSERMFEIFREFTPDVEEYSVDEAFLDIGGLRMMYRTSFAGIAQMIQERVFRELHLPVSIGVAPTKTLAKMASKRAKKARYQDFGTGIYEVPRKNLKEFYDSTDLPAVPGFGTNTVELLHKFGVVSLSGFVSLSEGRVRRMLHKPGLILWYELLGIPSLRVVSESALPKSISRIRTFRPTRHAEVLRMELANHLFITCYKLRRKGLRAKYITAYVRDEAFRTLSVEAEDVIVHNSSSRFIKLIDPLFRNILDGRKVRSVGIIFTQLEKDDVTQLSVFDADTRVQRQETLFHAVDHMNNKYGRYTIRPARLMGNRFQEPKKQHRYLAVPHLGTAE